MELIWREYKWFILCVLLTGIAAVVYYGSVIAPAYSGADRQWGERNVMDAALREKVAHGVPGNDAIAAVENDLLAQKNSLDRLKEAIRLNIPARFVPGEAVKRPKVFYQNLLIAERKRLEEDALKTSGGMKFPPALGFPEEIEEQRVGEYLQRLFIVSRILSRAIEAGFDSVGAIDGGGDSKEQSSAGEKGVKVHRIHFTLTGPTKSAIFLLHALQRKNEFFLIDQFHVRKDDATIDKVSVEMTVAGIVDFISSPEEKAGKKEEPSGKENDGWPFNK